jgi:hypothetical protein
MMKIVKLPKRVAETGTNLSWKLYCYLHDAYHKLVCHFNLAIGAYVRIDIAELQSAITNCETAISNREKEIRIEVDPLAAMNKKLEDNIRRLQLSIERIMDDNHSGHSTERSAPIEE